MAVRIKELIEAVQLHQAATIAHAKIADQPGMARADALMHKAAMGDTAATLLAVWLVEQGVMMVGLTNSTGDVNDG